MKASAAVVEHPEVQQVPDAQLVIGDRLLGYEDPVAHLAQTTKRLWGAGAEEVGVAQGRGAGDRVGVDAVGVLEVRADVGVRMVDRRGALNTGNACNPCLQVVGG